MSNPYLSQVTMAGFSFAPVDWSKCDGQLLSINQNQALFALIGTQFGGDGRTSFALPDLRGRTPTYPDSNSRVHSVGMIAGEENVTLNVNTMAAHRHVMRGSTAEGTQINASDGVLADAKPKGSTTDEFTYGPPGSLGALSPLSIANTGGGQAHTNLQPSLVVNFIIAIQGMFPSRN